MNLRKLFAVITILVMCTFLLSSCVPTNNTSNTNTSTFQSPEPTAVPTTAPPTVSTFVVINSKKIFSNTTQYIMYDPETMVMWSVLYCYKGSPTGDGVGLSHSPMYNADGTLRIYDPNTTNK